MPFIDLFNHLINIRLVKTEDVVNGNCSYLTNKKLRINLIYGSNSIDFI